MQRCIRLSLRTRQLDCYDYDQSANPPILHRKETFLHPTHPLHAKFARLTQQEEAVGLLADPATIGARTGWLTRLQAHGLTLSGHRLIKLSPRWLKCHSAAGFEKTSPSEQGAIQFCKIVSTQAGGKR